MEKPLLHLRASLCLGRWSLWLLLLGLVVPSASAQALSYREAVLRAVDRLNEQSSEANLYPESHLPTLILDQDEDPGTPKPVSFTVKETVCPRPTRQPPELCDFKENGRVKQCVGTVTLDQIKDPLDITCNEVSGPLLCYPLPHPGRGKALLPRPFPHLGPRAPGLALSSLGPRFPQWGPPLVFVRKAHFRPHPDPLNHTLGWGPALSLLPRSQRVLPVLSAERQ
uniref:Uncharacterized protein n=1 Tax=Sus scrofa TaxID=9823 RepID=A0A4X1TRD9_PIG